MNPKKRITKYLQRNRIDRCLDKDKDTQKEKEAHDSHDYNLVLEIEEIISTTENEYSEKPKEHRVAFAIQKLIYAYLDCTKSIPSFNQMFDFYDFEIKLFDSGEEFKEGPPFQGDAENLCVLATYLSYRYIKQNKEVNYETISRALRILRNTSECYMQNEKRGYMDIWNTYTVF